MLFHLTDGETVLRKLGNLWSDSIKPLNIRRSLSKKKKYFTPIFQRKLKILTIKKNSPLKKLLPKMLKL